MDLLCLNMLVGEHLTASWSPLKSALPSIPLRDDRGGKAMLPTIEASCALLPTDGCCITRNYMCHLAIMRRMHRQSHLPHRHFVSPQKLSFFKTVKSKLLFKAINCKYKLCSIVLYPSFSLHFC